LFFIGRVFFHSLDDKAVYGAVGLLRDASQTSA
jgi:hypothetical protein